MAYENRKFNWDFNALNRFYNNYVIKWINSAMSWSAAQMKQARANLGFGNGDIDTEPTHESNNFVPSGAIFNAIKTDGGAYDVSAHFPTGGVEDDNTYTLEDAIAKVPQDRQKGGMSICFVDSIDNKYVQYRLMTQTFSTNISEWLSVDAVLEVITGKNIYDYDTIGTVSGLVATNGNLTQNYNGFCTGLIPIKPNHYYFLTRKDDTNKGIRCLASDGTTKMKVLAPANSTEYSDYRLPNSDGSGTADIGQFKTPQDAAFVQISLTGLNVTTLGDAYKIMLEDVGDIYNPNFIPSGYVPYIEPRSMIKNDAIQKDKEPVENSTKPIESGAVYDLLNSYDFGKKIRVLLIGSSHGVNTISMFPVLANHAGIDTIVGNLYSGSATLGLYNSRPAVQIPYMADNDVSFNLFAVYENGGWTKKATTTISYALSLYDWDVVILQRGASEDYWDDSIANFYQHLLDYIKDNCSYNPRIYFNSGIANAARNIETCLTETNTLITTALLQKSQFGIDIIPTALAVQYARSTCLKETGQDLGSSNYYKCMGCDVQHLDTGIGQYVTACTVFEKIVKDIFQRSVRELDYLPVYSDVSGNVINSGSEYFTPITEYYARVAKTCAALAVADVEYKSDTATYLNSKFGVLPTTYTITKNLTGCVIDNEATGVSSDDVYMATLNVNAGLTLQSVVVTMGGNDVTSSVYATYEGYNAIRIGVVTGNIIITASAS